MWVYVFICFFLINVKVGHSNYFPATYYQSFPYGYSQFYDQDYDTTCCYYYYPRQLYYTQPYAGPLPMLAPFYLPTTYYRDVIDENAFWPTFSTPRYPSLDRPPSRAGFSPYFPFRPLPVLPALPKPDRKSPPPIVPPPKPTTAFPPITHTRKPWFLPGPSDHTTIESVTSSSTTTPEPVLTTAAEDSAEAGREESPHDVSEVGSGFMFDDEDE